MVLVVCVNKPMLPDKPAVVGRLWDLSASALIQELLSFHVFHSEELASATVEHINKAGILGNKSEQMK